MSPSRARFSLSSGHILGRGWMTVQQMVLNLFTKHMYSGQFSSVYESIGLSYDGARFPPLYLICHCCAAASIHMLVCPNTACPLFGMQVG